jgi:hypothetical protein
MKMLSFFLFIFFIILSGCTSPQIENRLQTSSRTPASDNLTKSNCLFGLEQVLKARKSQNFQQFIKNKSMEEFPNFYRYHNETRRSYFRGFAQKDFNDASLIRSLLGDTRYHLRSWDFSHLVEKFQQNGLPELEAIKNAEDEIQKKIISKIKDKGVYWYLDLEFGNTVISPQHRKKSATSIPFANELNDGFPIPYAKSNLARLIRNDPRNYKESQAIIMEIAPEHPIGFPRVNDAGYEPYKGEEYYVLSHVNPAEIKGAYIGYPSSPNVFQKNDYFFPKDPLIWFYVEVSKRSEQGEVETLRIFKAIEENSSLNLSEKLIDISAGEKYSLRDMDEIIESHPQLRKIFSILLSN